MEEGKQGGGKGPWIRNTTKSQATEQPKSKWIWKLVSYDEHKLASKFVICVQRNKLCSANAKLQLSCSNADVQWWFYGQAKNNVEPGTTATFLGMINYLRSHFDSWQLLVVHFWQTACVSFRRDGNATFGMNLFVFLQYLYINFVSLLLEELAILSRKIFIDRVNDPQFNFDSLTTNDQYSIPLHFLLTQFGIYSTQSVLYFTSDFR